MHMTTVNVWMRSKAKYLFIIVCVILMITWFTPLQNLVAQSGGLRGKIFDKPVSPSRLHALAMTIPSLYELVRFRAQQNSRLGYALLTRHFWVFEPYLRQESRDSRDPKSAYAEAWQALILETEAQRYGIKAGDADFDDFLKMAFPDASGQGLDAKEYAGFLEKFHVTESDFTAAMRIILTGSQLMRAVRESVAIPPEEAWLWYSRDNERVKADYLELRAPDFAQLVPPPEEEALRDFWQLHKDHLASENLHGVGYLEPEQVKIEYILCPAARFLEKTVITRRQVEAYYEAHKDQFRMSAPPEAGKPEAAPSYRPLAEVAPMIEFGLRREEAGRAVDEVMKEVTDAVWKEIEVPFGSTEERAADFASIAKTYDLKHETTDFFSADKADSIILGARELARRAFGQPASSVGKPSLPIACLEGKFIFQIMQQKEPHPAPFEEIQKRVEADYRAEKGYNLAVELAGHAAGAPSLALAAEKIESAISDKLKALPPPKEGAKLDPKTLVLRGVSHFFNRPEERDGTKVQNTTGLPGQFNYANFAEATFMAPAGAVTMALEPDGARAVFLLTRTGVQPADKAAFDAKKAEVEKDYLDRKRGAALETWLADVRRRSKPSPEAMKYLAILPLWSGATR